MSRYWTVWSATLLFFGAFYALLVPIPLYLEAVGLPDWQIGFVLGAFGVASLFGRPLAGAVNDSLGSRPIILFGTAALAAGAALMSFTTSPLLLFGLRVLQAAGYVTFTTAATALVAELAPAARRGAALALFGAAANVAITLTPATVSTGLEFLTQQFGCPTSPCPTWCTTSADALDGGASSSMCPLWGRGIGHSAFILSAGLSLLAGMLVWRVILRENVAVGGSFRLSHLSAWPQSLRGPMLTTALFGVSFGALFSFLPLLAERRELASVGAAYGVYGVSIIATRVITGRLLDRPDRSQVLLPRLAGECRRLGRFRRCLNHAAIACQRCSYGRRIRNHTPRPDLNLRRSHARHAARPRYRQLLFGFRSWNWAGELAAWPSSRRRRVDVAIPDDFTCQHCRRVDRPYFFRQAAALRITKNHSLTGQPERCPQMQRSLFGCNIQRRYPAVVACRTQTSGSAGRLAFSRTTSGVLANLTRSGG